MGIPSVLVAPVLINGRQELKDSGEGETIVTENRVTTLNIRSKVQADRRLEIHIPKEVPQGPVEVVVVIFPKRPGAARKPLTAGDLLRSPLFGLWKDREDIVDSLEFARKLRTEAEQRHHGETGEHT